MDLPLDEGGTCVPACLGRKGALTHQGLTTQAGEKSSMAWKADKVHPESGGGVGSGAIGSHLLECH